MAVGSGNGRTTIREIAELAGVSIATVSRVMNGREDVSSETRELVQRIVRERGYTTNRSARGLSAGKTGLIGGTVPMLHYPYFSYLLAGVAEALYEEDMRLVLCPTMHEHEREVTLLERLMHGTTDGAVIILPEESSDELELLLNHGYRFVVIDPLLPLNDRIPAVSAAHSAGADQAMKHLLSLGHRRIGAITGPAGWKATEDRRRGYYSGLAGAGIAPDPELEVEANFEVGGGADAAAQLLELADPPTAIFAFNDNMAIGAMQTARARGVRVPDELSIVGFDDLEEAGIVTPALTTIRQPLAEMGRIAVSLLLRLLDNQPLEALHVELATRLIVRESTAPPLRGA
jgi:LacI family transcriptional regulator